MRRAMLSAAVAAGLSVALVGGLAAYAGQTDRAAPAASLGEFGVGNPLARSSTKDIDAATAKANPRALATLASGLQARVVTSGNAAPNLDMMALWPTDQPKYLLACNEQGTSDPGVQRIELATGKATTIVTGTTSCDPLHVTPWGTVVFGEEADDGHVYEMIDPESITNATLNRSTGVASTNKIVRRDALGAVAFEGVAVLRNGVTYYGDELAPSNATPGGAFYKFVPSRPWSGGAPITSLDQSPLTAGSISALQVGQGSNTGQGMAQGIGTWMKIAPASGTGSLRAPANAVHATGFYRPEDISFDESALATDNVRFCGNNTGREQAHYFGETVCVSDGTVDTATAGTATPEVQVLVPGSPEYNMPDNVAFQPRRGNWVIHEDGETGFERPHNNDLWSCLPDGPDADLQGDGCVRIASLNDLSSEWTGGFFDPSGKHFYVSVQHNKSGSGVVLDITGWR